MDLVRDITDHKQGIVKWNTEFSFLAVYQQCIYLMHHHASYNPDSPEYSRKAHGATFINN